MIHKLLFFLLMMSIWVSRPEFVFANDEIISNSISLVSGVTTGQLLRPTKENGLTDRVFNYSGAAFAASTQGHINTSMNWSASAGVVVALDINKVIKRDIDLGLGYVLTGGPSHTTFTNGDVVVNSYHGSEITSIFKIGTNDFAIASSTNSFDDTSGSSINFFLGLKWEWYFTSSTGFGAEFLTTLYSFSSSTDNVTTTENRILFFASLL